MVRHVQTPATMPGCQLSSEASSRQVYLAALQTVDQNVFHGQIIVDARVPYINAIEVTAYVLIRRFPVLNDLVWQDGIVEVNRSVFNYKVIRHLDSETSFS